MAPVTKWQAKRDIMIQPSDYLAVRYRSYSGILFLWLDPKVNFIEITSNYFTITVINRKFAYWLNMIKFIKS